MTSVDSLRGTVGGRRARTILTPEGVLLPVELAARGERAAAVLIDLLIIFAGALAVGVLAILAIGATGARWSQWVFGLALLLSFAVRSFYFVFFELRQQGTTPGKRVLGLRVIDRGGGRLASDAVFARNLMREVEIFMPASLLLAGPQIGVGSWAVLLTAAWVAVFALMPFFNRNCLRAGDIVGGTWVIAVPKAALLPDMVQARSEQAAAGQGPAAPGFSAAQLDIYGIYELQRLEEVLREEGPNALAMQNAVAKRIQDKIAWAPDGAPGSRPFLEAFYAALRAHLETKMLLGVRREDKHYREGSAGGTTRRRGEG